MKCLIVGMGLILLLSITSWALKPDDPALVGLWLMDEGKGDVVEDSSGNKNHGKFAGAFDWIDGKFGKAVLSKASGSIDVKDSDSILIPFLYNYKALAA